LTWSREYWQSPQILLAKLTEILRKKCMRYWGLKGGRLLKIVKLHQTGPLKPHSLVEATRPGGEMADAGGLNPPDFKRSYGFESRPGHFSGFFCQPEMWSWFRRFGLVVLFFDFISSAWVCPLIVHTTWSNSFVGGSLASRLVGVSVASIGSPDSGGPAKLGQ
jgi:hypothetical protein